MEQHKIRLWISWKCQCCVSLLWQ